MSLILAIVCLSLSAVLSAMLVAFEDLSTAHLRHWAKKKDVTAKKLYPLKAKGLSVKTTLELTRAFSASLGFVIIAKNSNLLLSVVFFTVVLFVFFVIAPRIFMKPLGLKILAVASDQIMGLTTLLKPITSPVGRLLESALNEEPVTMTKQELSRIIGSIDPTDTDLTKDELKILSHALTFSDRQVHDVMTPKKVFTKVNVNDMITPVLIDDLYKSGHSRFPVFAGNDNEVVGVLYMHDLVDLGASGIVKDYMKKQVYFAHEEQNLSKVFQAFFKTKQHMFVVVNSFAEVVGVVTIEDVLEQIIGRLIVDEFDKYDDLRAVAESHGKKHRTQNRDNMVE